jgi:hypothetical protein
VYAKVFASMWDGTLGQNWQAWTTLVYLLANCDPEGFIDKTPEAIARGSGLPLEVVVEGLKVLESPDARSRSCALDGRRLERIDASRDWGWRIVNHRYYRNLVDAGTIREQNRQRQATRRRRLQDDAAQRASRNVTPGHAPSRQAEAEAEAEAEALNLHTCSPDGERVGRDCATEPEPTPPIGNDAHPADTQPQGNGNGPDPRAEWLEAFREDFWPQYPRQVGKPRAQRAWLAVRPWTQETLQAVMRGLRTWATYWRDRDTPRDKLPHPSTWLNDQRWENEP